jgi:hypothetical protein
MSFSFGFGFFGSWNGVDIFTGFTPSPLAGVFIRDLIFMAALRAFEDYHALFLSRRLIALTLLPF